MSPHTKGKTIIVMSTLDPDLMGELAKKVEAESDLKLIKRGGKRRPRALSRCTLSIMTSGAEDIVKRFRPYFDAMGFNTSTIVQIPATARSQN